MNKYTVQFKRRCPNNRKVIEYTLTIAARKTVMVESILAIVGRIPRSVFHEDAAQIIHRALPGLRTTLVAFHHGVLIETTRGAD